MRDAPDAHATEHHHPTLAELLATRARRASDLRLVIDVAVGVVAVLVAAVGRPTGWHLVLLAGLCFAAFGAWGITDRELRERAGVASGARWLAPARRLATMVGALAAVALFLSIFALALGTWIS